MFVSRDKIDNITALVQILARRWPGDKPLSEPSTTQGLLIWHPPPPPPTPPPPPPPPPPPHTHFSDTWITSDVFIELNFCWILLKMCKQRRLYDKPFQIQFIRDFFSIFISTSLKTVMKDGTDNTFLLIHVMAWHRTGVKPLAKPMMMMIHKYLASI